MFALTGDCWGHEGSGNRYFFEIPTEAQKCFRQFNGEMINFSTVDIGISGI